MATLLLEEEIETKEIANEKQVGIGIIPANCGSHCHRFVVVEWFYLVFNRKPKDCQLENGGRN